MAFQMKQRQLTPYDQAVSEVEAECLDYIRRLDRRDKSPIREDRTISDELVAKVHRLGRVLSQAGWYPVTDLQTVAVWLVKALPSHSYESRNGEIIRGSYGNPSKAEELRKAVYEGFGLPIPTPGTWYETKEEWQSIEDDFFAPSGEEI